MADKRFQIAFFLSLCPLLGLSCSPCFKELDRFESLEDSICYGDVYSAVVVEVTCNCIFGTQYDCRTYNAESSQSYSAEITTRLTCSHDQGVPSYALTMCMDVEAATAPGTTFDPGDPKEFINDTATRYCELPCPFNHPNSTEYIQYAEDNPCAYRVRVTEVFTGNYSVGDIVETLGPDVLTSCASEWYRVLRLDEEYLVGVGGLCSAFREWETLSEYTASDLDTLRQLSEDKDSLKCGSTAARAALLTVAVLLVLSFIEL